MATGTVKAPVNYMKKLPLHEYEKPFQILMPIPPDAEDQRIANVEFEPREQTFTDIRGNTDEFSLDENGFEIRRAPTLLQYNEAADQDVIKHKYLPEVEQILKDHLPGGYDRVEFFDWRVRDSRVPKEELHVDINDLSRWIWPVSFVHIDQAPLGVVQRVRLFTGDDADWLLQGRVRVINVWRPLEHQVEGHPLAFCDAATLDAEDLVECDHVRRKYKGATIYPYYNTNQKWYYLGEQSPDEVTILKIFDSDSNVKAKMCAHVAFMHPGSLPESLGRKSIEVRCLVFNYPEDHRAS